MERAEVEYTDEPLGELRIIDDFLPQPEQLVFQEETVSKHFLAEPFQEKSILDILADQADDLGTDDLSINADYYLYGLPKKSK
jgi:hypothetical protein